MNTNSRDRIILVPLLLIPICAFAVDVFLLPDIVLPAAPYFISILIAAYFLSPRTTARVAVFATVLKLVADSMNNAPMWLSGSYFSAMVIVGVAGTVLASKMQQEAELSAEREQLVRERGRLLREANAQRRLLQAVVDNAPAAIAVMRGPNLVFEMINPAYQAFAPGKTFIGTGVAEAWHEIAGQVVPLLENVLKTGEPFHAADMPLEIERAPGGPLELLYFTFSYMPLPAIEGEEPGILVLATETTEQVRVRKKIEELAEAAQRRALELDEANKELEAFSYSVSHDLRAPLRHVDGFSKALLEDYSDRLDEQGKEYLQHLRGGSQKMSQLIDDLLTLSRLARSEMHREHVDLSEMARSIEVELRKEQPERQAEFAIAPGMIAQGDTRLLRIMLENLLGNAWKFTSKRPAARIEFGVTQSEGQPAYYVRDDGAGFDKSYAGKLFAPFQRLHSEEEFPGTGIGLATVQRIVHRHGGRVWAEGEVNKGAAFYFTLS